MHRLTVAAFAVLVAASLFAQGGPSTSSRQVQWERYVSHDDGFSVEMPGHPTLTKDMLHSKSGTAIPSRTYMLDRASRAYMVMVCDYTGDISLDGAVKGILDSFPGATIVQKRTISFDGYPGRLIELKTPKLRMFYRIFAVDRTLYQVGYGADVTIFSADTNDYFQRSFRLLR